MMSAIVAGLSATVELTFRGNFLRNAVTLVHCGCGLCRAVCKNNKSRHDISGQPSKTFNNHTHLSEASCRNFWKWSLSTIAGLDLPVVDEQATFTVILLDEYFHPRPIPDLGLHFMMSETER